MKLGLINMLVLATLAAPASGADRSSAPPYERALTAFTQRRFAEAVEHLRAGSLGLTGRDVLLNLQDTALMLMASGRHGRAADELCTAVHGAERNYGTTSAEFIDSIAVVRHFLKSRPTTIVKAAVARSLGGTFVDRVVGDEQRTWFGMNGRKEPDALERSALAILQDLPDDPTDCGGSPHPLLESFAAKFETVARVASDDVHPRVLEWLGRSWYGEPEPSEYRNNRLRWRPESRPPERFSRLLELELPEKRLNTASRPERYGVSCTFLRCQPYAPPRAFMASLLVKNSKQRPRTIPAYDWSESLHRRDVPPGHRPNPFFLLHPECLYWEIYDDAGAPLRTHELIPGGPMGHLGNWHPALEANQSFEVAYVVHERLFAVGQRQDGSVILGRYLRLRIELPGCTRTVPSSVLEYRPDGTWVIH